MAKDSSIISSEAYSAFLSELKQRIHSAQIKAALAVNKELIYLYWQLGTDILKRERAEGWGSKIINRLSKDLKREFPDARGFSPRNLRYMRALAEAYPDEQIVLRVIAQIPWGHNQSLLNKLNNPEERLWYARKTMEYGWSRNILELQIETNLLGRQGEAATNFEKTLPPQDSDLSHQLLKDPYNFGFLTLAKASQERELERALVNHIREFLLELGVGFAFVGSQYRLEVGDSEFFIDLLFYHLKLRRYVVIDLKTTDFKPEHAGKMNFYVAVVDDRLRHKTDNPTIGLILCKSKSKMTAEYALRNVSTPIGVATHQLPDSLKPNLPTIEQLEAELGAAEAKLEKSENKPDSDQK